MVRFCDGGDIDLGSLGKWPKAAMQNKEVQELITDRYDAQAKGLDDMIKAAEDKRVAFMTVGDIVKTIFDVVVMSEKKTALIKNFEKYLAEV